MWSTAWSNCRTGVTYRIINLSSLETFSIRGDSVYPCDSLCFSPEYTENPTGHIPCTAGAHTHTHARRICGIKF